MSDIAPSQDGALPDRFRIFKAGWNDSTKGRVLFDARAARDVLADFSARSVDLMLDLNHDAVDPAACASRSDAADAMGWFRLEVNEAGELWAVAVRYTAEGEERIRARKQRYISPFFSYHAKTLRVQRVINCALVGMPATHGAQPLIAAKLAAFGGPMDPKIIQDALAAIEAADGAAALEVLKSLVAMAAGGGEAPPEGGGEGEGAPDEPAPAAAQAASVAARAPELDALIARLDVLEGRTAAADNARRRELVGELVRLRVEPVSEAWADPVKQIVSRRYAAMSIADLEERVRACRDHARTLRLSAADAHPPQGEGDTLAALSEQERQVYDSIKEPAAQARYLALRLARREEIAQ